MVQPAPEREEEAGYVASRLAGARREGREEEDVINPRPLRKFPRFNNHTTAGACGCLQSQEVLP